jgi:hypothetical protein
LGHAVNRPDDSLESPAMKHRQLIPAALTLLALSLASLAPAAAAEPGRWIGGSGFGHFGLGALVAHTIFGVAAWPLALAGAAALAAQSGDDRGYGQPQGSYGSAASYAPPSYAPPAYAYPAYAPPAYAPPRNYYSAPPAYYAPRPVYYAPAPRYYAPAAGYYSRPAGYYGARPGYYAPSAYQAVRRPSYYHSSR